MARIRAVLFDKDGTLVDFNRTWGPAAHAVAGRITRGVAAHRARLIEAIGFVPGATDLALTSMIVSDATPVYGARWAELIGRDPTPEFFAEIDALFAEETLRSLTAISGASGALAILAARGLPMGVATNDAEENARQQMAALRLDGHLPFIAGYDSGFGAKPGPGMVLAFARQAGVTPQEVALVGDTLHDLHSARAAGAMSVAVLTGLSGAAAREHLAPHADLVIETLEELPAALESF